MLIKVCSGAQNLDILAPVALGGCHELDRRMTMLEVVPAHEAAHPLAGRFQRLEAFGRIARSVLQGAEEGFDLGIVVADAGTAE